MHMKHLTNAPNKGFQVRTGDTGEDPGSLKLEGPERRLLRRLLGQHEREPHHLAAVEHAAAAVQVATFVSHHCVEGGVGCHRRVQGRASGVGIQEWARTCRSEACVQADVKRCLHAPARFNTSGESYDAHIMIACAIAVAIQGQSYVKRRFEATTNMCATCMLNGSACNTCPS